ncbi:MAG: tRNA uridine-5-carboxymethylaminomethyl(34) synthesis GTPase MnmE [Halieaceae bacterium MED-G27]|jgi:tRNA modification GTPase|nr:tRNA uridine-5-carboxymethylaminomethyl(34) synthesis GTPase MnmE [Halieaceae bacterium]OUT64385.1 MAG: tRNA uridine-5-carboxymethylaminomethyl(34) synthesis GTPase MnmE [Cellvibrionales bacterium TMED21]PDH37586.1 MAG: tRNA uridine-5-carboxymethylaminomethyl(34) synthesis GTPase MnmE [Halieaceae bacterium MED-G27]|tara:strand:- start:5335 stop:6678 length:1344 start_codon:yes stop_codon:yes gene_type:complete
MRALETDTIAAIATASGNGAIGVIRLSGPKARSIAEALTGKTLQARYAHLTTFKSTNGTVLDSGLTLYFPAPNSFTGEDVVELQGHGGQYVLSFVLNDCLNRGARLANPGEFSERAFHNEKIDLLQAEAIADLIAAETETAAHLATSSLSGSFSAIVSELSLQLTELRALTEASIDFPEEDIDVISRHNVVDRLQKLLDTLRELTEEVANAQQLSQGINIALMGAPNAGKSSLLNALAKEEVAIVTRKAGTTRDIVIRSVMINGLGVDLVDTAGLRETTDEIEVEGIQRAKNAATNADLILEIQDDSAQAAGAPIEIATPSRVIRVINKIDLSGRDPGISKDSEIPTVAISTLTGEGLDQLQQLITETALISSTTNSRFSARHRHVTALNEAKTTLMTSLTNFSSHQAAELLSEDLKNVQTQLDELTGVITSDDILGQIFSSFCIGK